MSRSYQHYALRRNFKEAYWSWVCYFSNKKSKRAANQKFRTKNKSIIKRLLNEHIDDMDGIDFHNKVREVMDNWDFSSDGLANHHYLKTDTEEDKIRNKKRSRK